MIIVSIFRLVYIIIWGGLYVSARNRMYRVLHIQKQHAVYVMQ
jgi:hypothetical protein